MTVFFREGVSVARRLGDALIVAKTGGSFERSYSLAPSSPAAACRWRRVGCAGWRLKRGQRLSAGTL
ncbi:MAG: hypothetical protein B7X59_04480 [Polaromonas sp. 39-63-203]|nr:MAG: hypothetical protein B7Y54_03350 [Polaromonas sp. 35-63-240]OYZ00391.1 MAG: hypothetical protein B7Y42_04650 [Polaromonas sp. 28-63-22]OYZ84263.1 MAG: hypothetical protein B7Y03_04735 [Polaromonas sp. 24-62-144]OZA98978.1 MAG: hypothetical protein B7X59_04480 [Polaromonas sp. 39-63-203]